MRAGSDLQGSAWLRRVEAPRFDEIELHHLYRTVGFLAEVRDDLERALFFRDRDLLSQAIDLVFIDTTSTFVYRFEESELRQRGYTRDRMPDQPQVVNRDAVTIDRDAVDRDRRLDGKFVLRTSTELPAAEVALAYRISPR